MGTSSAVMSIQVVQPQTSTRRHQMLHRMHFGTAHADGGGHACIHQRLGRNGNVHGLRQDPPAETRCLYRAAPGAASAPRAGHCAKPTPTARVRVLRVRCAAT